MFEGIKRVLGFARASERHIPDPLSANIKRAVQANERVSSQLREMVCVNRPPDVTQGLDDLVRRLD